MQTLHKQRGFLAAVFSAIGKFLASTVGKAILTTAATAAAARKMAPKPKVPAPPNQPTEAEIRARAAMAARDARRRARRSDFRTILTSPLGALPDRSQLGRRTLLGG